MANGRDLLANAPVRALIVGYPGGGKTGGLACLLNAGFKLRILDFDGNLEPLLLHANPDMLGNLDAIQFEDELRTGAQYQEPVGIPTAFVDALKMMDRWKYKQSDGTEVDLGASKDWGPDTIVVLDSLTSMGEAAKLRAMKMSNKTKLNTSDRVWGLAMSEQEDFIKRLTSTRVRHHVIVLAHLKMVGPRDIRDKDSDLTKQIKEEIGALVETRLYPTALGWQLPQTIAQHFPTTIQAKSKELPGNRVSHVLSLVPRPELDLKLPAKLEAKELDISDGMLTIFKALSPASVSLVQSGVNA